MAPTAVTIEEEQKTTNDLQKLQLRAPEALEFGNYKNIYGMRRKVSADGHYLEVLDEEYDELDHKDFAPTWNLSERQAPYEEFEFEDKLSLADETYPNLFKDPLAQVSEMTPKFGSEVRNVQLSQLTDVQKNELALFVAKRGVAVFRDQDLAQLGPQFIVDYGEYFGPLHSHPTSAAPKDQSKIHLVYKGKTENPLDGYLSRRINSLAWHSDVTYELQPPSITFLGLLQGPTSGGDTVFVDTVEAYNRLSPTYRAFLETLTATHSGIEQVQAAKASGGHVRRDPVENEHPLVRRIAATGDKLLYVNPQFTRHIKGLKIEESENILNFLYNFLGSSIDIQVRAKWEPNTVVVWDNRRTAHSAIFDWDSDDVRHVFRIASRLEIPTL